ncbi:SLC13 family permease [Ekhidna sp.]|uniref:SLC13 family permease n=1 Tax=Ekhidna sp. TaxID=2608089 RepID=UPI003B5A71DA
MTIDMWITVGVILLALVLFVTERFSVDVIGIGILVLLVFSGVISPEQGVMGFANSATLTVAAMFVLSDALLKTGIISRIAPWFGDLLRKGYKKSVLILSTGVGGISAFVNNTPVVATFIPIVSNAAKSQKMSPARYLIPLSFGAILGGTCTLIGTSTNLLVSGIAKDEGLEGFFMFDLAPLGLVFFAVGIVYLMLFGKKLIPEREMNQKARDEKISDYLCEIIVTDALEDDERSLSDYFEKERVIEIQRGDESLKDPTPDFKLQENDVLLVEGSMDRINKILQSDKFDIHDEHTGKIFPQEGTSLIEIVILPNSPMAEKKLKQIDFLRKYQSRILAIRQRGRESFSDLDDIRLMPGDILLLQTNEEGYRLLNTNEENDRTSFLSMRAEWVPSVDKNKLVIVLGTLLAVILLATFNVTSIMIAAFAGIVFLNVTNVITMNDAYRAIDWQVIFLLAGALSMGAAMNESGLSSLIGEFLTEEVGKNLGPMAVISAIYLTTSILTEIISNNAAAALLAPVAISIAAAMDVNPTPLLMTIAFAGSSSFITPVGYQTNTMVYSAGPYKYADFAKVGLPLKLLFWAIASLLIPVFYPL